MRRVLLLIGNKNAQRTFFLLRKDSVLYSRSFWENHDHWTEVNAEDVACTAESENLLALVLPTSEPPIASQDTRILTLADTATLLQRATKVKQIPTTHLAERDLEIIQDLLHAT